MHDVYDIGIILKRVRVSMRHGLISIVERHREIKPNQTPSRTVNACKCDSVVLNAVGHTEQRSGLGMCTGGDFSNSTVSDSINVLAPSENRSSDVSASVFAPVCVSLLRGERADYLSEYTPAAGGDVRLDSRRHTDGVRLFAGTKAPRIQACTALLDTRRPASFI